MKELYGVGVLFFYFLKWPIVIGYLYLRLNGLSDNYLMDIIWLYSFALILKDFYSFFKHKFKEPPSKNTPQ
jgi:hypothetical protein